MSHYQLQLSNTGDAGYLQEKLVPFHGAQYIPDLGGRKGEAGFHSSWRSCKLAAAQYQ